MTRQIKTPGVAPPPPPTMPKPDETVTIPVDAVNEAAVLSTMVLDDQQRARLSLLLQQDRFQVAQHREAFAAMAEVERRKLSFDRATVAAVGGEPTAQYLFALAQARGASDNVDWHVSNMNWDAARVAVATGPLPAFIEALRDPRADSERVLALARGIAHAFDGHADRRYLRRPEELIREMMLDIEERAAGRTFYPFGIDGLDYFEPGKRRLSVGAAPGLFTTITAVSGGGKSTFTLHIVLGLAGWRRQPDGSYARTARRRRVLYGAWEMLDRKILELLTTISLGWSRSEVLVPVVQNGEVVDYTLNRSSGPLSTGEGMATFRERAEEIAQDVAILANPFRRHRGEKASNERNLDIVQGYIADSGCEVFVADLWKRCLASEEVKPEHEEEALIRQQAMLEEQRVHGIFLQQQRLKDIEMRADKRPTREGIKGTGAWVEVSDNIIAPHWPFLFKKVDEFKLQVIVLKQREGAWPLAAEFDWNARSGKLWGGRPIEYDRPGEASELDSAFLGARREGRPRL